MFYKPQPWLPDHFSVAAIQGEPFSNSYNGWMDHTKGKSKVAPYATVEEAFAALMKGDVDFAFIPVANTIAQQVPGVMRLIRDNDVKIIDEVVRQIDHCALGFPGTELSDIRAVMSHPVALGQCKDWIRSLPNKVKEIPWFDTAGAARDLSHMQDPEMVVIAPFEAAEAYNLSVLEKGRGIQDINPNETRFVVLARDNFEYSITDKRKFRTALLVKPRNSGNSAFEHEARLTLAFGEAGHHVRERQHFIGKYFSIPTYYYEVLGRPDENLRSVLTRQRNYVVDYKIVGCFPEHDRRIA